MKDPPRPNRVMAAFSFIKSLYTETDTIRFRLIILNASNPNSKQNGYLRRNKEI